MFGWIPICRKCKFHSDAIYCFDWTNDQAMWPFPWLNWKIWLGLLNLFILLDLGYPLRSTHGSLTAGLECKKIIYISRICRKKKILLLSIPNTEGNSLSIVRLTTLFFLFSFFYVLLSFVFYTFIFIYCLTILMFQALLPKTCFIGKQQLWVLQTVLMQGVFS